MKIKNSIALFLSVFVIQSVSAARLKVINQSNKPVIVRVMASNDAIVAQEIEISPEDRNASSFKGHTFDSGFKGFGWIVWEGKALPDAKKKERKYALPIPSSITMLWGVLVIRDNGGYSINFNKNGASSSAVMQDVAQLQE